MNCSTGMGSDTSGKEHQQQHILDETGAGPRAVEIVIKYIAV